VPELPFGTDHRSVERAGLGLLSELRTSLAPRDRAGFGRPGQDSCRTPRVPGPLGFL